jgi:hypothetical protein
LRSCAAELGFCAGPGGVDRCSLWLIDPKHGKVWTKMAHGVEAIGIPLGVGFVRTCVRDDEVILTNGGGG